MDETKNHQEEDEFVSKRELRCRPLEAGLRSLIAQHIKEFYQVATVRALIKKYNDVEIYKVRELFENKLKTEKHVVGFISCITGLRQKEKEEWREVPGVSFWVIFDWPEYGLSAYESHLTKLFLSTGLSNLSCKAVRAKSKYLLYNFF